MSAARVYGRQDPELQRDRELQPETESKQDEELHRDLELQPETEPKQDEELHRDLELQPVTELLGCELYFLLTRYCYY